MSQLPATTEPITPAESENQPATALSFLRIHHLGQLYGQFVALRDLTLEIEEGTIYGLVGPNGAGKTTLLRVLSTLLEPSAGEVWLGENSLNERGQENLRQVRADVGYLPDFSGIYEKMKVQEYLDFFAAAYRVETSRRAALINDLLELVDLGDKREAYLETLSRGAGQKLALARTLVHNPRLLLLDEPANGLEPLARLELRELMRELTRMGKTVLLTSPILNELTEICTHIGFIEQGRLLLSGRVSDLLSQAEQQTRTVRVRLRPVAGAYAHLVYQLLMAGPQVRQVRQLYDTAEWEITVAGQQPELQQLLRYLMQKNVPVYNLEEHRSGLDDLFRQTVTGQFYR